MTPIDWDGDHVGEELALLLGGELDRAQLQSVVRHLRGCANCRQELVEASGAHAALTAARRILDPLSSGRPDQFAGTALLGDDQLPPLLSPAGSERSERRPARVRRRDVLVGSVAAVAAVAVALGGVAASGNWPTSSTRPRAVAAAQQATLSPVVAASGQAPVPTAAGIVRMSGSGEVTMTIRISGLPAPAAGHFYYAWLLDPSTNKMLPVGVVDPTGASTFDLGADLVRRYTAVDISLQADDGDPAHSPVSVLRASYGA